MNKYKRGKIYKIISQSHPEIYPYYGSTIQKTLAERMGNHRGQYKGYTNGKQRSYCTSYKLLCFDDAQIILVEKYSCESKDELVAREAYYIRKYNCVNKIIPDRKTPEYFKKYYQENKDKIMAQREYRIDDIKQKQKEWYRKNKQKADEMHREYYEQNKQSIQEKQSEKFICRCGGKYTRAHKTTHEKSKKHIKWIDNH
jgi:hypothetical protein